MRTDISPALQAELQSTSPRIARLLRIICKDGTTYGYTDSDVEITVDGQLYKPAPGLQALKLVTTADTEVSNQKFSAGWVDVPEEDLRGGKVDNAAIEGAWACWALPEAGRVVLFKGNIGEIGWDESGFEVDVVSYMKQLERNIGWTYTSTCRHQLFSQPGPGTVGACMANPASFTFAGTVAAITTSKWKFSLTGAAAGKAAAYFSNGQITFTSGFNSGLSTIVKRHEGDVFELLLPTAFKIQVGDTFSVQAGCDKTLDTCKSKFNNVLNHGGFPHINANVNLR